MISLNRKAHPDEKGTESLMGQSAEAEKMNRKAHPDEKGTERFMNTQKAFMDSISQGPSR